MTALPSADDIKALTKLARDLAIEAGELAKRRREEGVSVESTKSSDVDVVTAADREVEEWLRGELAKARPGDAILGEEEGSSAGLTPYTWVIDPIDGTVNYTYGLPNWSVSVAVVTGQVDPEEWELIAGAVVAPELNAVWWAGAGQGAFKNGEPISCNDTAELSTALLVTGFGYLSEQRRVQGRIVGELLPEVRDIRRLGSCAIDLCLVADGSADVYYETGINPWDMAAGALIATEAGCAVRGLGNRGPSSDMLLAGNPIVAELLATRLKELP